MIITGERRPPTVPYVDLALQHAQIKDELLEAIARVLDHGRFILGDEVSEFERRFAEFCGVTYAVGVNSGTDALILALKVIGVGEGDEVITTPNAFISCASSIALLGATPVFVDVRDDYNIDPGLIQKAITRRTRAILVVHLTGRPADMDSILYIARSHDIEVIEDCAQGVGAEYRNRRVGAWGAVGCFSLHPLKTLSACGDGGIVTTDDKDVFERLGVLRNIGLRHRDECIRWATNTRLDTMQAACLLVKLRYLNQWTEKRRANAAYYQSRLSGIPQVKVPADRSYERAVYHTFIIQAEDRAGLQAYLSTRGVETAVHYPVPIHLQPVAFPLGYRRGSFPVAESQADHILSLPVFPELDPGQLEYVADCIRDFYQKKGA